MHTSMDQYPVNVQKYLYIVQNQLPIHLLSHKKENKLVLVLTQITNI